MRSLQVNPWENGFPQGSQGGAADQLSLAGNLLGQILGRTAGVGGVGANLATSLVVAQVVTVVVTNSGSLFHILTLRVALIVTFKCHFMATSLMEP
jgi:hypothetical protein